MRGFFWPSKRRRSKVRRLSSVDLRTCGTNPAPARNRKKLSKLTINNEV